MWRPTASILFACVLMGCGGSSTSPSGAGGSGVGGSSGSAGEGATAGTAGMSAGGTVGAAGAGGTAGLGGSGGAAGSPDCAAKCGFAGCPACSGPAMVSTKEPEGATYRIDKTEVTNAQYAEFLAAAVPVAGQPSECFGTTILHRMAWNRDALHHCSTSALAPTIRWSASIGVTLEPIANGRASDSAYIPAPNRPTVMRQPSGSMRAARTNRACFPTEIPTMGMPAMEKTRAWGSCYQ